MANRTKFGGQSFCDAFPAAIADGPTVEPEQATYQAPDGSVFATRATSTDMIQVMTRPYVDMDERRALDSLSPRLPEDLRERLEEWQRGEWRKHHGADYYAYFMASRGLYVASKTIRVTGDTAFAERTQRMRHVDTGGNGTNMLVDTVAAVRVEIGSTALVDRTWLVDRPGNIPPESVADLALAISQ